MKRISKPLKTFTLHLLKEMIPVLSEDQMAHFQEALASGLGPAGHDYVESAIRDAEAALEAARAKAEAAKKEPLPEGRKRRPGGGRKPAEHKFPELGEKITDVILKSSGCSEEDPLYYTELGARAIADCLLDEGIDVSHSVVAHRMAWMGYTSHWATGVGLPRPSHEERERQFRYIADTAGMFLAAGDPVISVQNHSVMKTADKFTEGHTAFAELEPDTPNTLGASVYLWWLSLGKKLFPASRKLYVTADRANESSFRLWNYFLQMLADAEGLDIQVSHYPPGASRWKEIAHRFSAYASKCVGGEATREILATVCLAGPCKMMDMVHPGSMAGSTGRTEPQEMSDTENAVVLPPVPALVTESAESLDGTGILFEPDDVWNYTIHPGK